MTRGMLDRFIRIVRAVEHARQIAFAPPGRGLLGFRRIRGLTRTSRGSIAPDAASSMGSSAFSGLWPRRGSVDRSANATALIPIGSGGHARARRGELLTLPLFLRYAFNWFPPAAGNARAGTSGEQPIRYATSRAFGDRAGETLQHVGKSNAEMRRGPERISATGRRNSLRISRALWSPMYLSKGSLPISGKSVRGSVRPEDNVTRASWLRHSS